MGTPIYLGDLGMLRWLSALNLLIFLSLCLPGLGFLILL
jgi:hypothetical protein